MRLDWTDLRLFLHVCEAGSMTAAAQRAHLTLAAVSARIRGLEDSSGVVLLQRHARGVVPTAAGEVLARHARLVFEQVQRLQSELLDERAPGLRRAVLLANSSALARPLAAACAEHCQAGTPTALVVRESPSEATVQAIRCGAADVGIVSDAVDTQGLVTSELGPDPLVLVVARGHALAGRDRIAFGEVLAHPWVVWGEQGALSTHLLVRAAAAGARIEARLTYPRLEGVLQLVARGLGVSVLPRALVQGPQQGDALACVPLADDWARRRLLVCHLEGDDPVRAALAGALRRHWPG